MRSRVSALTGISLAVLCTPACLGLQENDAPADAGPDHGLGDAAWPEGAADSSSTPGKLYPNAKGTLPPNSGDGYIGLPTSSCQGGVHEDGANCGGQPCVAVGKDIPCQQQAKYRAYFRFELAGLGSTTPKSAVLHLYLLTKTDASNDAKLLQIEDFGSLETTDWDNVVKRDYSVFLTPQTAIGWLTKDVTAELVTELNAQAPAIAFELQLENETVNVSSSHWYGIGCAENPDAAPYIELTY